MSFDALAPFYRGMELVSAGDRLQCCRTKFLSHVAHANNILILGEGNGRFLVECRRTNPSARITCVDASTRMLALARERLQNNGAKVDGVSFICADALRWTADERYDGIVTHFFLDCFQMEELRLLIAKLGAAATADAVWLLADFQLPPTGFARWRAQLIIGSLYAFFRVATRISASRLVSPDSLLAEQGFRLRERRETEWGLLHSDWWQRAS